MAELKNTIINDTEFIQLPSGTTAQRPASPSQGMIRWNSDSNQMEYYNGTTWFPNIVTDGLVLHLDAAEPASYPGSGTTWFDLSGNENNGTLVNGPTYSGVNGGVIVLDGNNNYIDITLNLTNTNYTVMGAARYVTIGGRTFSAKDNNWLMGHWNSSTVKHYAVGWVTDSSGTEQSDTNWRVYAATGDYSGDSWGFYVNGALDTQGSGGSNGPNNFAIGSYIASSEFSNSHISFILAYNRVLSAAEIQQNFNALRDRYGI